MHSSALVLSHLHYSAIVIHAIEQNIIVFLEKQLNGVVNFRQKFESVQDIERSRNLLLVKLFLQTKRLQFFKKIKTVTTCFYSATGWNLKFVSSKMQNSFVRLAILDWNELLRN